MGDSMDSELHKLFTQAGITLKDDMLARMMGLWRQELNEKQPLCKNSKAAIGGAGM